MVEAYEPACLYLLLLRTEIGVIPVIANKPMFFQSAGKIIGGSKFASVYNMLQDKARRRGHDADTGGDEQILK